MADGPPAQAPPQRSTRREDLELLACVLTATSLVFLATGDARLTRLCAGLGLSGGSLVYAASKWGVVQQRRALVVALVGAGAGLTLALIPSAGLDVVVRLIGGAGVLLGALLTIRSLDLRAGLARIFTVGALFIPMGLALIVLSAQAFPVLLWGGAALIGAYGAVRLGQRLGLTRVPESADRPLLLAWIDGKAGQGRPQDEVCQEIFFEGDDAFARTMRFALMMLFASVISALGVIGDSTAIVVGAMLIAPLISPMMGMALSLVMGWSQRLVLATIAVLGGIVISVGSGWLVASAFDLAVDVEANTQVISRASPTIADLAIAVTAGAAGAYTISRKDASSSLPGVAISIALVPPLSVVGIAAEQGSWAQAAGTGLLFATNLVAILLIGGAVFVLTGTAPLRRTDHDQRRVRVALGSVAIVSLMVGTALTLNSASIVEDSLATDRARRSVTTWLGPDSDLSLVSLEVDAGTVTVVLAGTGSPPPAAPLANALADDLGDRGRLDLQWIPRQQQQVTFEP